MDFSQFLLEQGSVRQAIIKAKNIRLGAVLHPNCSPVGPPSTQRHHAEALTRGQACFKCSLCANALLALLNVMEEQEKRGGPWTPEQLDQVRRASGQLVTVDQFGIGKLNFRIPRKTDI